MPFKSDAQRKFLWSQKPEVAKKFAEHHNIGGIAGMDGRKPSKITKKDRYGNQITMEFEPDVKPLDQTAIVKHMMDQDIPELDMEVPMMAQGGDVNNHPGGPKGSDTVPAWLTPGEFVVNKEATEMYGPIIEEMNNHGRAIQHKQSGGEIKNPFEPGTYAWQQFEKGRVGSDYRPEIDYRIPEGKSTSKDIPGGYGVSDAITDLLTLGVLGFNQGGNVPFITQPLMYKKDGGWITDELLDKLMEVESGGKADAVSPAGAVGLYQWLPSSAKQPGYGVKAFNPKDAKAARKATADYLKGMQKYHGFTPEETLRAYNWGPGNVIKHKKGIRKDIPDEALNYPGKILGFDKVKGVPAPAGMPVPKARPEGLGIPEAMPTPRPKPDDRWQVTKDLEKGWDMLQALFKQDGGPIPHFDTLASNYTPPELPSNVKPELTDVPKGHKMFGGDETFAGTVNAANPNLVDDLSGSNTGSVNIEDEGAGNVPWYSGLLGPKSKEMLDIPLEGEDKEWLDNQTAMNEKLASAEIAEEENQIADMIASEANTIMEDEIINQELNEIKKDEKKKGELAGEISQDTAEKDAKKTGEAQTGPDANQPGPNKSEEEIVKKGETANKGVLDGAKNALVAAFGDLFDSKELARMGILYAGSRLLGYSHGGSLQYAAKNYLTRVDAKAAGHDKYVKELAKSGKYSTKSIAAYQKSKDLNDLIPIGTPITETGQFKTFYGPKGQQVRATQVKQGKNTYWITPDGKKVNASYTEDASLVKGTPEYGERIKKDTNLYTTMIKDLRSQFGTTPVEGGKDLYATELAPSIAGGKVAKWAADNKIPAEYMGSIVENAYHSALQHGKDTGEKVRDLTPFLEEQYVISQVGDSSLFKNKDGGQISGTNVSNLISQVQNSARAKGKIADTPTLIAAYRKAWNGLSEKEQKLWNAKATEQENGFMKFVQNDITKSYQ